MEKHVWIQLVSKTIKKNPKWAESTINALQHGIIERLDDEMQYSTDIEVGFMSSLDKKKDNSLILKGLKALRRFGKTKWQENMINKFKK